MGKHLGLDVLHKESSARFFFTIYILKSVFCKGNSVEYGFDRCIEFYVETQQKMTENTHWKHALKVHRDSPPLAKASAEIVVMKHFA